MQTRRSDQVTALGVALFRFWRDSDVIFLSLGIHGLVSIPRYTAWHKSECDSYSTQNYLEGAGFFFGRQTRRVPFTG
jgi:hypothetical protein